MTEYTTRNLTVDESAALVRKLHVELGNHTHVDTALRVIAELGFGIFATTPVNDTDERLEYLRRQIRAERISYGEIAELQSLAPHIDPSDVELLEWAGVEEFPGES